MDILTEVRRHFPTKPPLRLGVAVSGGGDSMALMHILTRCFAEQDVKIFAATDDHGLRAESAEEAAEVARVASQLGVDHEILQWRDWSGQGNLQGQARRARYDLLTDWAKRNRIKILALGHTADDQAETVLMGLARASGVDGLAAMPVQRERDGLTLLRPMLTLTRARLRDYLKENQLNWIDDPSNDDQRFERVRVRQAMDVLEPLGLTVSALVTVAENMARAREALDQQAFISVGELAEPIAGAVVLDQEKLLILPDEIVHRLLTRALQWVSGAVYPLRRRVMAEALQTVRDSGSLTLGGCRIVCRKGQVWICREYNAVRDAISRPDDLWDNRWRLSGGETKGIEVRALGKSGLQLCPDWREISYPRAMLEATPALWNGPELVAAPVAGFGNGWVADVAISGEEFLASILSH